MGREQPPDHRALNPFAAAMDEPHDVKALLPTSREVFLHRNGDVARRKRVQVEFFGDGNHNSVGKRIGGAVPVAWIVGVVAHDSIFTSQARGANSRQPSGTLRNRRTTSTLVNVCRDGGPVRNAPPPLIAIGINS